MRRITPAHAGTTLLKISILWGCRDHPRSRGNHLDSVSSVYSPFGITPAHAGTTSSFTSISIATRDHPRSRGNHAAMLDKRIKQWGSPPLTREPPFVKSILFYLSGITPAHAGTTRSSLFLYLISRDHPRSRGNHEYCAAIKAINPGSPPLTREPLTLNPWNERHWRITPAHAGTTRSSTTRQILVQDHPRSRGNHRRDQRAYGDLRGSPPLTREPPEFAIVSAIVSGITPAHAGTT